MVTASMQPAEMSRGGSKVLVSRTVVALGAAAASSAGPVRRGNQADLIAE